MSKRIDRKEQIFAYIISHTEKYGYPPTVREICAYTKMSSTSSVYHHLDTLKREGRLSSQHNKSRGLTIQQGRANYVSVPLLGNISAGQGILAQENLSDYIPLPADLFGREDLFTLKVQGNSMINVGISNNDYVVVKKQNNCDLGDIVVVLWDNVATVKRLTSKRPITLHPENDAMEDIIIPSKTDCTILGKVVGCLKKF